MGDIDHSARELFPLVRVRLIGGNGGARGLVVLGGEVKSPPGLLLGVIMMLIHLLVKKIK